MPSQNSTVSDPPVRIQPDNCTVVQHPSLGASYPMHAARSPCPRLPAILRRTSENPSLAVKREGVFACIYDPHMVIGHLGSTLDDMPGHGLKTPKQDLEPWSPHMSKSFAFAKIPRAHNAALYVQPRKEYDPVFQACSLLLKLANLPLITDASAITVGIILPTERGCRVHEPRTAASGSASGG